MKKWIRRMALLLTVLVLMTVVLHLNSDTPKARAAVNVWGDADGNGEITENDALLIKQYRAGLITEEGLLLDLCDVDDNGQVDVYDAYLVQLYASGVINKFPVENNPVKNYFEEYAEDPGQTVNAYVPVVFIEVPEDAWATRRISGKALCTGLVRMVPTMNLI